MADFSVKDYTMPQRWKLFQFYGFGGTAVSYLSHTVTMSSIWRLAEVRVTFSAAVASDKYLQMILSAAQGSYYDAILYSANIKGSTDILLRYSDPLLFQSDDTLDIITSQISVTTTYGVQAIGWAVTG